MSEAYLDHAATAPVRDSVIETVARVLRDTGNASSLHAAGRRARREVEQAREQVAAAVGAHPMEVVFTSGATEADNLAVIGGFRAAQRDDPSRNAIAVSAAEHPAVLDAARALSDHDGADVRWIEVGDSGAVESRNLADQLADGRIAVAAAMWVNNEVGTITDVDGLADTCREYGVPLHVDAVQALGRIPIDFAVSGLTSLAVSAHKIGGPQGIGALVAKRSFSPMPLTAGGGQERKLRSGTLSVAMIAGFGVAADEAAAERERETERLAGLRRQVIEAADALTDVRVNGPRDSGVVPGIVNLWIEGADADAVLMLLDSAGVQVSTGSACTAGVSEPSHVVLAMTGDPLRAKQSIRVSMGRTTTSADVELLVAALPDAVARARLATGYAPGRG